MSFGPLEARTLGETVVRALRQAISDGEMAAGERIIDGELAARLGVSRATVRDALRQLAHEGLIVCYPHRGYFVADFQPADILELLELRSLLEGRVAAAAVMHLTADDFRRLEEVIRALERRDYATDVREIRQLDIAFHQIIADRCIKPLHAELWAALNSRMIQLDRLCRDVLHLDTADSARRHRLYVTALRSRDPKHAREAAEEHYAYHRERYQAILDGAASPMLAEATRVTGAEGHGPA